ncbi:MAG TPA: pyrroline-5-carboxylate reductase [Candidatus Nanopelagicales bacterium]|nr:pyrroline-5-carboxylate reductase [Candidatus Nanopelagicales bacterium]
MGEPIHIAMVGGGVMGGALVEGFLEQDIDGRPVSVRIVESDPTRAQSWSEREGIDVVGLVDATRGADIVFLAVKPHQIIDVLDQMQASLSPHTVVASIAAGVPVATLRAHLPASTAVIRVMPNTPVRVGKGVMGLVASPECSARDTRLATRLLESSGLVVEIPEEQLDALTATSGSGPAYVFYLAEAMREGAKQLGLPADVAAELVAETITGAAELLAAEPGNAQGLRESVTSKGGTTAAAIAVFDEADMRGTIARAMRANVERSREMADDLD